MRYSRRGFFAQAARPFAANFAKLPELLPACSYVEAGNSRMMRLSLTLVFLSLAIGGVGAQSLSESLGARNNDSRFFSNISSTTSPFALTGGNYQVCVVVNPNSGTVKLESSRPDNATYLPVNSKTNFTADGCATVNLPPGQYEFVLAGATSVYASISSIPQLH
jgi:hypothetical protein